MDRFIQDILARQKLLKQGDFEYVKAETLKKFQFVLPYEYKHGQKQLSAFSIAFLDLYREKASILIDTYSSRLQDNLTECYKNAEEEDLQGLTVADDLSIHSICFPENENETEWEVDYEMDLDDTIFHVYFEGWKFKNIGQTH